MLTRQNALEGVHFVLKGTGETVLTKRLGVRLANHDVRMPSLRTIGVTAGWKIGRRAGRAEFLPADEVGTLAWLKDYICKPWTLVLEKLSSQGGWNDE